MPNLKKIIDVTRVLSVIVLSQIYLALALVGAHYIIDGRCQLELVPWFLMISAFCNFSWHPWRSAKHDLLRNPSLTAKIEVRPSMEMQGVNLGLAIFGSFAVFSQYSTWNYEDVSSESYCETIPYVLAFAMVVHQWLLVAIFVIKLVGFYCWAFWTTQQILMLKYTD